MHLIICEKDNAAKRLSGILSDNSAKTEKKGRVSIYRFQWEGEDACTIGLRGHIMNLDFPKKYNSWTSVDPASLVDLEPVKILSERSIGPVLRSLAKESSSIYVATDYDREGELIVAGTNPFISGSPYSDFIEPGLSTGKRIAREIKLGAELERLNEIIT